MEGAYRGESWSPLRLSRGSEGTDHPCKLAEATPDHSPTTTRLAGVYARMSQPGAFGSHLSAILSTSRVASMPGLRVFQYILDLKYTLSVYMSPFPFSTLYFVLDL